MRETSRFFILFLLLMSFFFSCNHHDTKEDHLMSDAEKIVEAYPDSAAGLLDSIKPKQLNKKRYHRYMLLLLQAKDKSYQDITTDTAIFDTKSYYVHKQDLPNAAMAAYYCGRLRYEQKNYKKAMSQYLEAEKYATSIANVNLKALIQSAMGAALSDQMLSVQALPRFQQAAMYFRQAGNEKNEMISYQLIGHSLLVKEQTDSALFYFNKALQIAQKCKYIANIAGIEQNIGILYKEVKGDNDMAKKHFFNAMQYMEGNDYSRICLKLAGIYSNQNQKDSAEWYMQQSYTHIQDKDDSYLMADIYMVSASIKEKEQNYKAALQNYKIYSDYVDSIYGQTKDAALLNMEKKYKFEQLTNKNMTLALEKQKIKFYSSIGIILSLIGLLFYYRKYSLSKKRELEAEQKIYHLMDMAKSFDEKEVSFRNVLLHQFDIIKKTATLKNYIHKEDESSGRLLKKFNEIIYGEEGLNWDILYKSINELHNGFFDRLREKCPNLNEDEFRICCLTYTNFSSDEISIIMGLSVNTIQMKRSTIRKRLNIPPMGNIQRFLNENLSHT